MLWELSGSSEERQQRALRLIGVAFATLAVYLAVQSVIVLASGHRAAHSRAGIAWTGATVVVVVCGSGGSVVGSVVGSVQTLE